MPETEVVTVTTYGVGGYLADAPNQNIVEVSEIETNPEPPTG